MGFREKFSRKTSRASDQQPEWRGQEVSRRSFMGTSAALLGTAAFDLSALSSIFNSPVFAAAEGGVPHEVIVPILDSPLTLENLELFGSLVFTDFKLGQIRQKNTLVTAASQVVAAPLQGQFNLIQKYTEAFRNLAPNFGSDYDPYEHLSDIEHGHNPVAHANAILIISLLAPLLAGKFGEHAQQHALEELLFTSVSVALLGGKELIAEGFEPNEAAKARVLLNDKGEPLVNTDPERVIRNIVLETTVHNIPMAPILYTFGNSNILKGYTENLVDAVTAIYDRDIGDAPTIEEAMARAGKMPNKVFRAKALEALDIEREKRREIQDEFKASFTAAQISEIVYEGLFVKGMFGEGQTILDRIREVREAKLKELGVEFDESKPELRDQAHEESNRIVAEEFRKQIDEAVSSMGIEARGIKNSMRLNAISEIVFDIVFGIAATANDNGVSAADFPTVVGTMQKHGPTNTLIAEAANAPYAYANGIARAERILATRAGIEDADLHSKQTVQDHLEIALNSWKVFFGGLLGYEPEGAAISYSILSELADQRGKFAEYFRSTANILIRGGEAELKRQEIDESMLDELHEMLDNLAAETGNEGAEWPKTENGNVTSRESVRQALNFLGKTDEAALDTFFEDIDRRQASPSAVRDNLAAVANGLAKEFQAYTTTQGIRPEEMKISDVLKFAQQVPPSRLKATTLYHASEQTSEAFAETSFDLVITGLSLTFLIPTLKRGIYDRVEDWSLTLRETASTALHYVFTAFTDNWADVQIHNDILADIYTNNLYNTHIASIAEEFFGNSEALRDGYFETGENSYQIPARYAAFIGKIQDLNSFINEEFGAQPEVTEKLQEAIERLDRDYWKGIQISQNTAVAGSSHTINGRFIEGVRESFPRRDFGLRNALADISRHPVQNVSRFIGSTFNGWQFAPWISKMLAGQTDRLPGEFLPSRFADNSLEEKRKSPDYEDNKKILDYIKDNGKAPDYEGTKAQEQEGEAMSGNAGHAASEISRRELATRIIAGTRG